MFIHTRRLLRWSLQPAATKGWNPTRFKSFGAAFDMAIATKRMRMSWLAQGTRIPIQKLKEARSDKVQLDDRETQLLELYLGVPLRNDFPYHSVSKN